MQYYKLSLSPDAPTHVLVTVSPRVHGTAIVVAAIDEAAARRIASRNYVAPSAHHSPVPLDPWETDATTCEPVEHEIPPRMLMLADHDLAPEFVDEMELRRDDEVVARMHWWPCAEGERCPV